MRKYIEMLCPEVRDLIYLARDVAARQPVCVYVVGGFVRDLVLGVENLDLDFAVEGDGIRFAEAFASRTQGKLMTHKRFGTATVTVKPKHKIDIASTRKEFYPRPASLPVVNPGSLQDDLLRRDFTINTLAIDINQGERFGDLVDPFGGRHDIRSALVRVLHDMSFVDDPTRLLRAIRFEQRYRFCLEPRTLALLHDAVKLNILDAVSPQRLRDELILLLKEQEPARAVSRVQQLLGWDFLAPGLRFDHRAAQFFARVPATLEWFRQALGQHRHIDTWLVYLMGLVSRLDASRAQKFCERFEFARSEACRLLGYIRVRDALIARLSRAGIRPRTLFDALEPLSYEAILAIKAASPNRRLQGHIDNFFRRYHGTRIAVGGHDLKGLGIEPGPHYQKILHRVLTEKLNGKLASRSQELAFVAGLKHKKR